MSRIFGEVRQNGYVVRDIEAAMKHWLEVLGVGPFFYIPEARFERFTFRGVESDPRLSLAFANSGDLQIELIQQHNDAPSMYVEFLNQGREGLQHVSSWEEDIDAIVARAAERGIEVGQRGTIAGGIEFVYFDTGVQPGTVFEVSNLAGPLAAFPQMIADAARSWDGSDPIRVLSP